MRWRFTVFALLLPLASAAVQPYAPKRAVPFLEPWRWRAEEALKDLNVLCMDEAADGTLWFGCIGQLVSYDGKTVRQLPLNEFLPAKTASRPGDLWVRAVQILPDNTLVALIGETLMARRHGRWEVLIETSGSASLNGELKPADDGSLWLMVPDALWKIPSDFSAASKVLVPDPGNSLLSFCFDAAGQFWAVEKTGVYSSRLICSDGRKFPIPFETAVQEARITAGEDGLIWYVNSTALAGLQAFDSIRNRWIEVPETAPKENSFSILCSRSKTVLGAGDGGLLCYSAEHGHAFYSCKQLGLPRVPFSLFESASGRVWLIGRIGRVFSMDPGSNEWKTFPGLNFQAESPDGNQWFLTYRPHQVISYNPQSGEWLEYGPKDHQLDKVFLLFRSSHNLIWAAGQFEDRAAVSVFDGVRWSRLNHPKFAYWIRPNAAFEAADGTVWFGAGGPLLEESIKTGGALRFEVKSDRRVVLRDHYAPPEFPYYVTAFGQTPDGVIWLGSTHVFQYDGTSAEPRLSAPLEGENTAAIAMDKNRTLWLAKEHLGVCRWTGAFWEIFTEKEGLAGTKLADLAVLSDGSLLAASDQGISRFDGQLWTAHAYSEQFAMGTLRCGIRQTADGAIWLNYCRLDKQMLDCAPETEGLFTIRHRPESDPPDTWFTDHPGKVSPQGNIQISWSGRDAWSATRQSNLSYSWRLNDGPWSSFSDQHSQSFARLKSGRHVLEVRARDLAFNVDPTPARIEFPVAFPVWMQPWFILLISALLGIIVLLVRRLIRLREQHLIEQQQERERHLLELDRIKTGFFTNISHELRTPVTVILGRLEMLLKSEKDESKKQMMTVMAKNARRVTSLITELLDFKKIETGHLVPEPAQGDLAPFVRDLVEALQPLAEAAGISCRLESIPSCRGWFDFDKLQKIFTNLIGNAIKYTGRGGEVIIRLAEASAADGAPALRFTVEDNGPGIPPEHLDHIFERFYRVPEASMAVGAGIGLNLTKELVQLLNGEIQVESPISPDVARPGSRFTVRLPVVQGTVESVCSDPTDRPDQPDKTDQTFNSAEEAPLLLIVEDDADIREFICDGLKETYRLITAGNGRAGLELARTEIPELMITDVMMPEMDGTELCRQVKAGLETSHIPVIMLTAKSALDSQLEGLKTRADDYITKPFHLELLQVRIANLLESRRVLREKFRNDYPELLPRSLEGQLDQEFFEKMNAVLKKHYADSEFTPEQFADALHMSLRTLQRKMKAVSGRTPMSFINAYRITRAAELLTRTSKTVTEITFEVGLTESSNFAKLFKKHLDQSPSDYRREHSS